MSQPIVTIEHGNLLGLSDSDISGNKFFSFLGIPYAKPPLGELRFKAPQPAEPWTGIRDATKQGSESLSKDSIFNTLTGSEDCLYLNVYTPKLPDAGALQLKPVMVFIHGGAFMHGSSSKDVYGPDFLIREDIVLVTINYRLGILGFLSLDDPSLEVPGNAGLKDMVMALKWIQKNIASFNGNPNNVTIFGESSGSAACHFLMLSPMGKGLFHRAILQSGVTLNPWSFGSHSALLITNVLGHKSNNEKEALEYLKSIPAEKFFEAQQLIVEPLCVDRPRIFGPVIEKPHPDAFLTKDPLSIMLSGDYYHVPIIIGYTNREGMHMENSRKSIVGNYEYRIQNFEKTIPRHYNLSKGSKHSLELAKKIEDFYYGNSKKPDDDIDKFYIMWTDLYFLRGIYLTIKALLQTSQAPIYFYRLSVESELNLYKKIANIKSRGASHADDIGYLFKTIITPPIIPNKLEEISIYRITKLWTTFAKTGNPNPTKDTRINVTWKPTSLENLDCLDIGKKLKMIKKPDIDRMLFWDNLSAKFNSKL